MTAILEKWFALKENKTSLKQESFAALTTFSTMAYIIVVNPLILSKAGLDFSSCLIATILTTAFATLCMGFIANYPFALAPGMGMNAYFTYSIVLGLGIAWQTALGISFYTGVLLILLWAFRLRQWIIDAIPEGIKIGTTAGIGLFLVLIALNHTKIIVAHPETLIGIGNLMAPESLLTFFGIIFTTCLLSWRIQGALLIGVILIWILALAFGLSPWKGVFAFPQLPKETFFAFDLKAALSPDIIVELLGFLFVCLFDTAGSLMGLARQGGFINKRGELPRLQRALLPDALGTTLGGVLGTSPTVIYIESASGIAAGGKTGLSNLIVAGLFLCALFFSPLVSSIPFFAVAPVLIIVGSMMLRAIVDLKWDEPSTLIPCFVTFVGIPLTYSIGLGIGLGMVIYPICKLFSGKLDEIHPITWILATLFAMKFIFS